MITQYNRKSLWFGIPGFALVNGCPLLIPALASKAGNAGSALPEWFAWLLLAGAVAGLVLWIIGLGYYAKAKGYSGVLGLLGLLSCVGLLILVILPDKELE